MGRRWSAEEDPAQSRLVRVLSTSPHLHLAEELSHFLLLAGCPQDNFSLSPTVVKGACGAPGQGAVLYILPKPES